MNRRRCVNAGTSRAGLSTAGIPLKLRSMLRSFFMMNLVVALFAAGCGKAPVATAPAAGTNAQIFQVNGVVLEVRPREKSVTIKHEAVPNYMPAMTMPFEVRDTNELAGLGAGDPVTFRLLVSDTEGWIDRIRKTGPKTNTPPTTGAFRRVRDVEPLNEGDLLPEYHFTNQLGQAFSTAQFKGQALAIEFLFTRCPFPTFCPFMANNFAEAQKKLRARPNAPANWQLLTISFDPEFDTPEILRRYAEAHGADPAHWTFATGELIDITALGEQFSLAFWHEDGSISHNLRAAVVDTAGRVQKIFAGNQWTSDELVAELERAAAKRDEKP